MITKANLYGHYFISTGLQQQKGILLASENRGYGINFILNGRIASFLNYIYSISYNSSKSNIEGTTIAQLGTISSSSQRFVLNVFPNKALVLSMSMHYNQSVATSNLPSTFFMDLRAKYRFKRLEFNVDWNNIFNANQYVIAGYNDFFSSVHSFELRPANIVLSVRFAI